ncbi:hypothetical protein [Azospirillum sp. SYSU D00513]|uniref:hypothetical protein n=1 Tax=Azospirillum sp. SYSU D00513 TaxID=2812561 RepID=UPI001A9709CE|nr:hypothetical protein [Azospirillum sp. SYSU D00513]
MWKNPCTIKAEREWKKAKRRMDAAKAALAKAQERLDAAAAAEYEARREVRLNHELDGIR